MHTVENNILFIITEICSDDEDKGKEGMKSRNYTSRLTSNLVGFALSELKGLENSGSIPNSLSVSSPCEFPAKYCGPFGKQFSGSPIRAMSHRQVGHIEVAGQTDISRAYPQCRTACSWVCLVHTWDFPWTLWMAPSRIKRRLILGGVCSTSILFQ